MFEKLLLSAGIVCASFPAHASSGYKSAVISFIDDTQVTVNLKSDMEFSFSNDSLKITAENVDLEYSFDDVQNWTYSHDAVDERPLKTATVENDQKPEIAWEGNALTFNGLQTQSQVSLFSVNGQLIDAYQCDGNTVLSLDKYPSGMYLITVNNTTFKFRKK
jgi:hypothetical protein